MEGHPGPKPRPFEFPFGEAQRLRAAAEALADDVRVLVEQSRSGFAHAAAGFRGDTRSDAEAGLIQVGAQLDALRRELEDQAVALEGGLRRAAAARAERDARIVAWQRDLARYRAAQATAGAR